jgi:hypothetical protein
MARMLIFEALRQSIAPTTDVALNEITGLATLAEDKHKSDREQLIHLRSQSPKWTTKSHLVVALPLNLSIRL